MPFLHRFSYQFPTFLFLVFAGCLIYNLFAFPFSRDARLKVFFVQEVDLNTGVNNVTLIGLDGFVQDIVEDLPSAAGQEVNCGPHVGDAFRSGLTSCIWSGLEPNVVANESLSGSIDSESSKRHLETWLSYNVMHSNGWAQFTIQGRSTKQCRIVFDRAVSDVQIEDAASDPRYKPVAKKGSSEIRLLSREWDKNFEVNVTWSDQQTTGQTGKVICLWNDANQLGTIPAFDELRRFGPVWSAVTKTSDGLVEGFKKFTLS